MFIILWLLACVTAVVADGMGILPAGVLPMGAGAAVTVIVGMIVALFVDVLSGM